MRLPSLFFFLLWLLPLTATADELRTQVVKDPLIRTLEVDRPPAGDGALCNPMSEPRVKQDPAALCQAAGFPGENQILSVSCSNTTYHVRFQCITGKKVERSTAGTEDGFVPMPRDASLQP